jgi:hypothetical protein
MANNPKSILAANPSSISSQERREPDGIDAETRSGYLPGINGVLVYAAIDRLALSDDECELIIKKTRSSTGKFTLSVDFKKI